MNAEIKRELDRQSEEIERVSGDAERLTEFVRRHIDGAVRAAPDMLLSEDGCESLFAEVVTAGVHQLGLDPEIDWAEIAELDQPDCVPDCVCGCDCCAVEDEDLRIVRRDLEWRLWCNVCGRHKFAYSCWAVVNEWNSDVRPTLHTRPKST